MGRREINEIPESIVMKSLNTTSFGFWRTDNRREDRRGSAAVELALCLPFIFTLVFGVIEVGRGLEVSNILTMAVREGGRFGATDKQGYVPDNTTANAKIVADIRNYLVASGIPNASLTVNCETVPDAGGSPTTFNFEDPTNHLKEFRVTVSVPFSAVSYCPTSLQRFFTPTQSIATSAVFRNYHK